LFTVLDWSSMNSGYIQLGSAVCSIGRSACELHNVSDRERTLAGDTQMHITDSLLICYSVHPTHVFDSCFNTFLSISADEILLLSHTGGRLYVHRRHGYILPAFSCFS
jgi:hypothetical protein